MNDVKKWVVFALKLAHRLLYVWMPDCGRTASNKIGYWLEKRISETQSSIASLKFWFDNDLVKGDRLVVIQGTMWNNLKLGDIVEYQSLDPITGYIRAIFDGVEISLRRNFVRPITFADLNPPEPTKPPAKKKRKPATKKVTVRKKTLMTSEPVGLDGLVTKETYEVRKEIIETPVFKPNRIRRSKAQIEADNAEKRHQAHLKAYKEISEG